MDEDIEHTDIPTHQNSQRQSPCYKIITLRDALETATLQDHDGYLHCFPLPMEGTSMTESTLRTLFVLNYIVNQPLDPSRVLDTRLVTTHILTPENKNEAVKCQMVYHRPVDWKERFAENLVDMEILKNTVDKEPRDFVSCYMPSEDVENSDFEDVVVPIGEIYIAPVHVTRKNTTNGSETFDNFWLVILKTLRNFDFSGHIGDIIASCDFSSNKHKDALRFRGRDSLVNDLETVLLFSARMSPNAREYMKKNNIRTYIFEYLNTESPLNIDYMTNIFEAYRAMRFPPWQDNSIPPGEMYTWVDV